MSGSKVWAAVLLGLLLAVAVVQCEEEKYVRDWEDEGDVFDDDYDDGEVETVQRMKDVRQLEENVDYRLEPIQVPNFDQLQQCDAATPEECELTGSYEKAFLVFNDHTMTVELHGFLMDAKYRFMRYLKNVHQKDIDPVAAVPPYMLLFTHKEDTTPTAKVGVDRWDRKSIERFVLSTLPFRSSKAQKAADEL